MNPRSGWRRIATGESANPWTRRAIQQTHEVGGGNRGISKDSRKQNRPSPSLRVQALGLALFHGFADSPVALLRHPYGIRAIAFRNHDSNK